MRTWLSLLWLDWMGNMSKARKSRGGGSGCGCGIILVIPLAILLIAFLPEILAGALVTMFLIGMANAIWRGLASVK